MNESEPREPTSSEPTNPAMEPLEVEQPRGIEAIGAQAERALLARPGFSIRARLALFFLLFFVVSAGITIVTWVFLTRLETRLEFLETADRFNSEILQARRFEKNFLLYGTDLDNVLLHTDAGIRHLASSKAEFGSIVGVEGLDRLEAHLARYRDLIVSLGGVPEDPSEQNGIQRRSDIERQLREHGAQMVAVALDLAQRERDTARTLIEFARGVPLAFLVVIVALSFYGAYFLSRHLIRRLNRLMELTRRIGAGDLSPIMPTRKFKDEFTNLVIALNHMMGELERRHDVLVQSHKLRAVGSLTAGVAHELNNPINNIMLTAAMLQEDYDGLPDDERIDMINDLVDQAERAQKIVRNLLDFARESEMGTEQLHLDGLVKETLALVANQLKLSAVKSQISLPENMPPINGDRQYLSQVFLNLVLNAVDAMPDGGALAISAEVMTDRGFVATHLSDTGVGIPEHILGSVFDPFFTTKPTGHGTGLGLSVSLGIVRKHGGDIKVRSTPGKGTTFTVLLPILKVPAALKGKRSELT